MFEIEKRKKQRKVFLALEKAQQKGQVFYSHMGKRAKKRKTSRILQKQVKLRNLADFVVI